MIAVTFTVQQGAAGREAVIFEGFAEQSSGAIALAWPADICESFLRAFARWRTDPEQRHSVIDQVASVTACVSEGDRYRYMMTLQYRRRPRDVVERPTSSPPAPAKAAAAPAAA
jgi:hypothetical protein